MRTIRPSVIAVAVIAASVAASVPAGLRDSWGTVLIYAAVATALNMVAGSAGQLSLGHGALLGVGAYAGGKFAVEVSPEMLLTLPVAAVAGGLIGLAFGIPSLRVRGQYLALVTIGGGFIFVRLVSDIDALGAEQGLIGIPFASIAGDQLSSDAHTWIAVGLAVIAVWIAANVTGSHLGRRLAALKDDETVAETAGVDVYKEKLFVFVSSAVICAVAGAVFAHKEGFISASAFDLDLSLMLLLSCIVGGLGRPLGGAIGVLVLMAPPSFIPGSGAWDLVVGGLAALAVLFLMPDGVAGAVRRARGRHGISDLRVHGAPAEARARDGARLLVAENVSRSFGGVKALDSVSIQVTRGQIHAVIGPNGSGKTTLMDCLTGVLAPDGGRVQIDGEDGTGRRPHEVARLGVARTFQRTGELPSLSVIEAASLAVPDQGGSLLSLLGSRGSSEQEASASGMRALHRVGLGLDPGASSRRLSFGEARRLELARAIASAPGILVLDEPAAGLDPVEVEFIAQLLASLRQEGMGILLADHHMNFVLAIADTVSVLDHGELIAQGTPEEIRNDRSVIDAYLGTGFVR